MHLNNSEVKKWFDDNGDYTHNITYDLNENSIVMDLGAYTGNWADQIIRKYNCNMYLVEPIEKFYKIMVEKYLNNKKINIINTGVGLKNEEKSISLDNDASSTKILNKNFIKAKFVTIETILQAYNLNTVDLLQINIEGDEYDLLENMLDTGLINKFKNIQIQFHLGIGNEVKRREDIRDRSSNNYFKNNFNYPFVWESWSKI